MCIRLTGISFATAPCVTPLSTQVSPGSIAWTFNYTSPMPMVWERMGDVWSYFDQRPKAPYTFVCPVALLASSGHCEGDCTYRSCLGALLFVAPDGVYAEMLPPKLPPLPSGTHLRANRRQKRIRTLTDDLHQASLKVRAIEEKEDTVLWTHGPEDFLFPCPCCQRAPRRPRVDVNCGRCGRQRLCRGCGDILGSRNSWLANDATLAVLPLVWA